MAGGLIHYPLTGTPGPPWPVFIRIGPISRLVEILVIGSNYVQEFVQVIDSESFHTASLGNFLQQPQPYFLII